MNSLFALFKEVQNQILYSTITNVRANSGVLHPSFPLSFSSLKFLSLYNREIPLNGLKVNRNLQKKGRNSNDSFEVSSTCCDRNNKLIGTITDSL